MSRILKRPMFRIGGQANEEGIMSMVVPKRAGYEDPNGAASTDDNYNMDPLYKDAARRSAILSKFAGTGKSQSDRISNLLIRGGLKTMSERPTGNIFATTAKAFSPAVDEYLKEEDTEESFQRQLKLAGVTQAMTFEDARKVAEAKAKGESNLQKDYSPDRMYYEAYTKYTDPKSKDVFKRDITTDYPESFASFIAYIQPSAKKLQIDITGVVPNRITGNANKREFFYEEMIAGGTYFDPRTKNLYQRDPEKNIAIEINPYNKKIIREIPLK
jgi:hypothetical protein